MQNDSKQNEGKSPESQNVSREERSAVFSPEESRAIVKEFLKAYIGGKIVVKFQDATEIMNRAKLERRSMDYNAASLQEITSKTSFTDKMGICLGSKEASGAEKQKAVNDMIEFILIARSSQRMQGEFLTFDAEKMISDLREDLDETNRLVAEIMVFLKTFKQ